MAGPGRNAHCPCGSGRKVKRCCGERKGPSEEQLGRAFLAGESRHALRHLANHEHDEFEELFEELVDLPAIFDGLVMPLPRMTTPAIQRLRRALRSEDDAAVDAAVPDAVAGCDSWRARAELARAVIVLREDERIDECVAAVAMFDLAQGDSALLEASLLQAVAIDAGVVNTSSGLMVVGH